MIALMTCMDTVAMSLSWSSADWIPVWKESPNNTAYVWMPMLLSCVLKPGLFSKDGEHVWSTSALAKSSSEPKEPATLRPSIGS